MHKKDSTGLGKGGFCICPKCEERIAHRRGIPCQTEKCPKCGAKMLREGSEHHQLWEEKRQKKAQS
jgi:hypothetical protein